MRLKRSVRVMIALVVSIAVGFTITAFMLPRADSLQTGGTGKNPEPIHLTAIGDSLTHGVGDTTKQGGYVPLIAQDMGLETNRPVTTANYGKTGDTARQIQKRLRKSKQMRADLKRADAIVVTAGGNDLMHLLQKKMIGIKDKDVTRGINKFQKHLTSLLDDIRAENPTAPIYVYGIYNPFYVYFTNIKKMQASVVRWNDKTAKTLAARKDCYYVDINGVLSRGAKKAAQSKKNSNTLIYGKDHFHPNNAGYVQMADQLWEVMQTSEEKWNQ